MEDGLPTGDAGRGARAGAAGEFRGLAIVVVSVIAVVAFAALAVLALGSPHVATYPAGSPEDAFQRYVAAIDANDFVTARSLLSDQAAPHGRYLSLYQGSDGERRVWIDSVDRTSEERVLLHVTVERTYTSGAIGVSSWRESQQIEMVYEHGAWKLDRVPYGL